MAKKSEKKKSFEEDDSFTPENIWKKYNAALDFNLKIGLDRTVKDNENFFIGKQWEGVQSNGLPTPVFNFLKRDVLFSVASNTSDNIKVSASPLPMIADRARKQGIADVVNAQFDALFEKNKIPQLVREYTRNAAVDGDGCLYTYWDADEETGQDSKGGIRTEVIENTRVFFGNPNDRRVETQPWIIIVRRLRVPEVKASAAEAGCEDLDSIMPDTDGQMSVYDGFTDDKVTVLLMLYRDRNSGTIHACESTRTVILKKPYDLGIRRYPVCWMNWDYVQDCYHGMAMITGLLNNQQFVNKMFAMVMVSQMHSAFPRTVYDKTRIRHWTNQIGAAIGIEGGDVNGVASIIAPAQISPQVSQVISSVIDYTQSFLGATSAALGNASAYNTSAIIALQRASNVPMEITKQNMYDSIEDLALIYLEFMAEYYGKRYVELPLDQVPSDILPPEVTQFAQGGLDGPVSDQLTPMQYDFSELKDIPMQLRLDVGASSYWSEIASVQTLDNLLQLGQISITQYLERVPDGFIPKRSELISELKQKQEQAEAAAGAGMASRPEPMYESPYEPSGGTSAAGADTLGDGSGGYGALQRSINANGAVPDGVL